MSVLKVDNLAVSYRTRDGEIQAVRDVSFDLAAGACFGLVGESGCGKSTVAWSIVGFLGANGYVESGRIRFQGEDLVGRSAEALRRLRGNQISMVYQDPMAALNPSMRIGDQLRETLIVHRKVSGQDAHDACARMLDRVHMPDPENVLKRYPHQLSGGQQQRVVIAMALLNNPALLIMDEPTTALDVTVEAAVLDLVEEVRSTFNTAILFISHNLGIVSRVCDQVGVMYSGELVETAPVRSLFKEPQHPYTRGLMRCVPTPGDQKTQKVLAPIPGQVPPPGERPPGCAFEPRCDYSTDRCRSEAPVLRKIVSQFTRCHLAEEIKEIDQEEASMPLLATGRSEDVLKVDALKTYYSHRSGSLLASLGFGKPRDVRALDGVDFHLSEGLTLGVVGESGCGKSTLVRTLIGLEKSCSGSASYKGFDLTEDLSSREMALLRDLQMVFQNPDSTLNPAYPVGKQIGRVMRRFGTTPKARIRSEVERLLAAVRLDAGYYDRLPRQLSGGEKQRVGIARAFASRPGLVLCDEPVSALDVSVQAAILNLLLEIQQEYQTTMVFIAHDLSVVRYFSDLVAVMYLGKVMEFGPSEAIYSPPFHPYTEALLSAVPLPDPDARQRRIRLEGSVPSALHPPPGCVFHTRCPRRELMPNGGTACEKEAPPIRETDSGHRISCHLSLETLASMDPVVDDGEASHA